MMLILSGTHQTFPMTGNKGKVSPAFPVTGDVGLGRAPRIFLLGWQMCLRGGHCSINLMLQYVYCFSPTSGKLLRLKFCFP